MQLPPPNAQMGCVEASLRAAMEMAVASAQARRNVAQQKVGYFAYGSNMYPPRIQEWAKSARPVMVLGIPGFVMKFNKLGEDGSAKRNIVHTGQDEDIVAGVVLEMTFEDLAKLNEAEKGYERMEFTLDGPNGPVTLLTHVATRENTVEGIQPYCWYKHHILEAAKMFKLPQAYIDRAITPVEAKDPPPPADFE